MRAGNATRCFWAMADVCLQVQALISDGIPPGLTDMQRRSGAHFAANHGELAVLQLLQSKGADLDAEDTRGRAPLHYAALHNHEAVVKLLADAGCWLDATDAEDCTPLHCAAQAGAADAAARLLKSGAKARLRNTWELTPAGVCHHDAA